MANWKIRNKVEPAFDGALMDARFIRAGMFIVRTKSQRNSIKSLYRDLSSQTTTLCFVEGDSAIYKLINNPTSDFTSDSDWLGLTFQSSALSPVGNWDKDNNIIVLSDAGAAGRDGEFYFVSDSPTATVVTYPGLFGGNPVTVSNGMYVVSVGSGWIIVSNATTWDAISKPSVITDYVNGIVISHSHTISDITGLLAALDTKYDIDDIGDHSVPFIDVPDEKISDIAFLRQFYYTRDEVDSIVDGIISGGGAGIGSGVVTTSSSTLVFNFTSKSMMTFTGSVPLSGSKTFSFINVSLATRFEFLFEISSLVTSFDISAFFTSDSRVTSTIWEPLLVGKYKMVGTYDGTKWWIDISQGIYI